MNPSKTDYTNTETINNHRTAIKVVNLANMLDAIQNQLKILRRREKLLKGTGPLNKR
ncbi:MAG: hypothetical protein JXB30_08315 [Anaerolineae bacterium]|nr:hypothetical protein [Anaerolineae bacterium]